VHLEFDGDSRVRPEADAGRDDAILTSRMLALGSSMFPWLPSGSMLTLEPASPERIRVGDIVVYPALLRRESALVAHRVIALELAETQGGLICIVRGDAQRETERVPASACAYVVTHVSRAAFRYRTSGLVGRVLARAAVERGPLFGTAVWLARGVVWLRQQGRAVAVTMATPTELLPSPPGAHVRLASQRPMPFMHDGPTSRDSMLRGLKHEFRTPLNAILGFTDLLLGELDGPLDPEDRENVQVVREAGATLLGLINEVLDLVTALMAPGELVWEHTDVAAWLEENRRELEQRCGMRPVHVRVAGDVDGIEARLERRLVSRALRALGDMALSGTAAGEIAFGVAGAANHNLGLWIAADGFDASVAVDGDVERFVVGPVRPHDRVRRLAGMRFSIARALLARLGAVLSVSSVHGNRVLGLHIPVVESAAQAPRLGREGLSEVTLALDYIAAMGHDLRTPLNAILGFSDLLTLQRRRPWSDAQQRSLEIVRERAIDLSALVDDMIDWAKLEAGELVLTREEQPVLPLIERALAAAQNRSGSRGLAIELQASPELARSAVRVEVDASRCVQALLGLLDHAIRSNPGPSVVVRVQCAQAGVQVDIFDPGLEIREEDQSAVFDAFRPSHAPTGHRIAGLQLGPAVARSLLRAHGGDVWFESRAGRGTTFTATVPASPRPPARAG